MLISLLFTPIPVPVKFNGGTRIGQYDFFDFIIWRKITKQHNVFHYHPGGSMKAKFTVICIIIMAFAALALARDQKFRKPAKDEVALKTLAKADLPQEPIMPLNPFSETPVDIGITGEIYKTAASSNRQLTTSGSGYGWLNPSIRCVDRYAGIDNVDYGGSGEAIDFMLFAYRGPLSTGIKYIHALEVDIKTGLASGAVYQWETTGEALNTSLTGEGGRYPSAVALEKPFVSYNQYSLGVKYNAQDPAAPALSHPYCTTDFCTYGTSSCTFIQDSYQMDEGWLNPKVTTFSKAENRVNRLWNGSTAVVKDAVGDFHWAGVYDFWYSDYEAQAYSAQNEVVIMRSTSSDPTGGWTDDTTPTKLDYNVVSLPRHSIAMNSTGFGVVAGPGHLGWHDPDSGYYYSETKITYAITTDYGNTWSAWDTVSFSAMGFPMYHNPANGDSMLGHWEIIGPDTVFVWYTGPTFMGTNFDMDVIVNESNDIFVGFNSLWGEPTSGGWYPNYNYSGPFCARKLNGQPWQASQIYVNNGVFVGDENLPDISSYFFDSEIDLALDEVGNIYAVWLDRPRTGTSLGVLPRYGAVADGYSKDYKTDVFASRSIDKGLYWSAEPLNITNTTTLTTDKDEYELKGVLHASSANNGTMWVGYAICDNPAGGDPNNDGYVDLVNQIWAGEINSFAPPSNIDDQNKELVAKNFFLHQNYPNPFNPVTRIEFTPVKAGQAVLTVYSVSGEKVAELFNGYAAKGTTYTFDFDGSQFAAGVYLYRLTMQDKVEVKKMVLIK